MSVILSSPQQINQHTLNTSSAKALYSFSKAERRCMVMRPVSQVVGYDVPNFKSTRSTSFGFGDKKIQTHKDSPPPTSYNIPSCFDQRKQKSQAFTFGLSRESFQRVYLENHLPKDRSVPGPGQYESINKLGENALKLTIGTKTLDHKTLTSQKFVPGPGTYEPKNNINQNGQYVLSNMKSTLTPSFSLPSLKQLKPGRRLDYVEMMKYVPGPGQYTPKLDLGDKPVVSAFRQSIQPSLYNHDRFPRNDRNKNMPGPGYYQTVSDFGIYGSPKNIKTLRTSSSLFSTKNSDNSNAKKSQSFVPNQS